jgi:large subunit ribosomal protein L21e
MAQRIGGFRRKTRSKLSKNIRARGKLSIPNYFQIFKVGDGVQLCANPTIQKGMYHPKYHGKAGIISEKQGKCYSVTIKDGGKHKSLLVHPIHLKRIQ